MPEIHILDRRLKLIRLDGEPKQVLWGSTPNKIAAANDRLYSGQDSMAIDCLLKIALERDLAQFLVDAAKANDKNVVVRFTVVFLNPKKDNSSINKDFQKTESTE